MNWMSKTVPVKETTQSRVSVLDMTHDKARTFFLKQESYCTFNLPCYFIFATLLTKISEFLALSPCKKLWNKPSDCKNINHTILSNKDGKFAWRPLQLIHPALYVSLVHEITESSNWELILKKFITFSENSKIRCMSLPVEAKTSERDIAQQISKWWEEIEQPSIELSLDYDYLVQTDITNCYGSIYTHSVAWALHGMDFIKKNENRKKPSLIGNIIDRILRDMNYGQTNGIPQGSVLMNFIAEMVLGYADILLTKKIDKTSISNYQILRYRDDYRIFVNHPIEGEKIVKLISESIHELGLQLNPAKTNTSNQVIRGSIKADKIEWMKRRQGDGNLQKHLLLIHDMSQAFSNSGTLNRVLTKFSERIFRKKFLGRNPLPMIAIVADIARHNPNAYPHIATILSKLIEGIKENERKELCKKIIDRLLKIPNSGYLEIWLQRFSYPYDKTWPYEELMCKLVTRDSPNIWSNDWIESKELKEIFNSTEIVDPDILQSMGPVIDPEETKIFDNYPY